MHQTEYMRWIVLKPPLVKRQRLTQLCFLNKYTTFMLKKVLWWPQHTSFKKRFDVLDIVTRGGKVGV